MGPEANIDAIRVLEEQIREGEGDMIKLKRARNSLLSVSTRVPPEILGHIFAWNLVRKGTFDGLRKDSYNFLLVCHHWFEVASRTPELWSFWGNTLQDWKKRHHRSKATPLDLVGYEPNPRVPFDESLQDAVRSRVVRGTIRQVHLRSYDHNTLTSIISSLTPDDEGGWNENIESIVLESEGDTAVDVSDFFARSRLSRLCSLKLYGSIWNSSWDQLGLRTTLLTSLYLEINAPQSLPILTAAQLFSILTSNPNLRSLTLSRTAIPDDTHTFTSKVQLRDLKMLALRGEFRHLFGLLSRLILPERLDHLDLVISNSTVKDISQTFAPYMQDYFQRGAWFRGRLRVHSSSSPSVISISVRVLRTQTTTLVELPHVSLRAVVDLPPPDGPDQIFTSLAALIPRERVVTFRAWLGMWPPEEVFVMMSNIETLYLAGLLLSKGLLQPSPGRPHANTKLFPSLRSLCLENVRTETKDDWGHLVTYLAHQTSDGQAISLEVLGDFPHDCPELVDGIRGLVKEFTYPRNPAAEGDE